MRKILYSIFLLMLIPVVSIARQDEPLLKVGVLSDVHLGHYNPKADSIFVRSLEYFKSYDVDAVIIAGDFLTDGTEDQMKKTADLWFSVFPDDKGRKGKHVERIFVYGNHEIDGHKYAIALKRYTEDYLKEHNIADNREEYWEKYFHEPFQPFYRKNIKGYTFLAAHYVNPSESPGMAEFFEKEKATFPSVDKPMFYIQHKHPKGTVPWYPDNGVSTEILSQYPNIICFSGHCHHSLTDEKSIWQGSFTCVNTASLRRMSSRHYLENGAIGAKDKEQGYVPQMAEVSHRHAHHCMFMKVYEDRVELDKYDLHYGEVFDTWTIPTDVTNRPYAPEARTAQGAQFPPVFKKKASVRVERALGKDRNGTRVQQVQVFFPRAETQKGGLRALNYEVVAEQQDGDSIKQITSRIVYPPRYFLGENALNQYEPACYFAEDALPKGVPIRFAVYPMDSWDNKGTPIYSKFMVL